MQHNQGKNEWKMQRGDGRRCLSAIFIVCLRLYRFRSTFDRMYMYTFVLMNKTSSVLTGKMEKLPFHTSSGTPFLLCFLFISLFCGFSCAPSTLASMLFDAVGGGVGSVL